MALFFFFHGDGDLIYMKLEDFTYSTFHDLLSLFVNFITSHLIFFFTKLSLGVENSQYVQNVHLSLDKCLKKTV